MATATDEAGRPPGTDLVSRGRALALAAGLALVVAVVVLRQPAAGGVIWVAERVRGLGGWGPIAYTGALTAAIPLCLPAAPFLLAAGILFGAVGGIAYAAIGTLVGGALAFLLGRRVFRARVERRLASEAGFEVMTRALRREGARGASLIRLSPVLPAWLVHYALGVSRVRWRDYWLSSIAALPSVLLYVFAGVGLGDLAALERGGGPPRGPGYYALLGVGILATLAASVLLGRRARRILQRGDERDGQEKRNERDERNGRVETEG